jgi:hypothetical protein
MAGPGNRDFGEDLAPCFALRVEGTELTGDLTKSILSVEYESALDIADMCRVVVANPGFALLDSIAGPDMVCHKAFQPGNYLDLYMGYGNADTYMGRTIISRHLPHYPASGVPTLTFNAYDLSQLLMNMEGGLQGGDAPITVSTQWDSAEGFDKPQRDKPVGTAGRAWPDKKHHEIVQQIARDWHIDADIDEAVVKKESEEGTGIIQPKGVSDYKFLKMLANINDFEMWVDYSLASKRWVLHWKTPQRIQRSAHIFKYRDGDDSTIIDFSPDYGIRDTITEISVLAWDDSRHIWVSMGYLEGPMGQDPVWRPGGGRRDRIEAKVGRPSTTSAERDSFMGLPGDASSDASTTESLILENLHSGKFRLAAAGVAIDIIPDKPFESIADCAAFARRWFMQRRDHFMVVRGTLIGLETLRARQVHTFQGLGPRMSGQYYFIAVKHIMTSGRGIPYKCEFVARKVIS